jgi:hypothetical protein
VIYEGLLPRVVKELTQPEIAYWPGSPNKKKDRLVFRLRCFWGICTHADSVTLAGRLMTQLSGTW